MLEHKVVQVMIEYNRIQNDYKEKCKNRIQRQLEISKNLVCFVVSLKSSNICVYFIDSRKNDDGR